MSEPSAGRGTLYVVATPIGNLGDLTPRAAEVLRRVRAVAAEDTRRTLQLFAHLGAPAPQLLALPAFDERGRLGPVLARLAAGEEVALCTDAGTPGVSDPGQQLVAAAWEAGARVVPLPGPCAAVTALVASGLPSDRFFVQGFLPRKGGGRAEALALLRQLPATLVIYEAGNRTPETLSDLAAALGDRPAAVARELTKLHEELARGTLRELAERFAAGARGEVTLVVAGAAQGTPAEEPAPEPLEDALRRRMAAGEAPSAIAREVAKARGLKRADVYAALERLKGR
ncbi:16S rRNA (cytidine(1402)-2'-O)-methyltransferase [Anaeromyxobacter diazotrophicus]|uniref:Ribosomal RNA small subunit methyltransferase I n=1 Tax=Anaeromyxobacter diazotrophicus TaxID=2590199 RepID=A0A7I9VPL6_9BACT|nr:16S rRNA (cytidine(1402)-2'-O)-methyltransferase [Anaeromyxobacter diazotrophicus]GEJ58352.1 ribosomal RNA small subunit methyltransferase I [Anaeromyxobacter diazotrophicus]